MNNNLITKWLLTFTVVLGCISMPNYAACSEKYYINSNRVFLYKIINWWYDCLSEESQQLCGSLIRCQTKGNIQIEYDTTKLKLKLNTKESFADLLSVFKQCEQCWGPSYLKLTWLNKEYFGDGKFITPTGKRSTLNSYIFDHIERTNAQRIQSIVGVIGLELEGVIRGVMNGKIALHHSEKLLKSCQVYAEKHDEYFPTTLKIVNSQTEEILAKLSVVFDDKNHSQTFSADSKNSAL
ncbi:MAG: hypothetical protein GY857_02510 [Desulfobacula sp.]|nr:hypothetical protein [Desulfobacula sp.]